MKKIRILLVVLSIVCCFVFGLTACKKDNSSNTSTQDKDILAVYNMYVAYAKENNVTPLSYEDWLLTLKGEKGDKGEQGIQGEKGDKGEQGIQGEKGDKGEQGIQGEKGDKGEQGIQGEKGDQGEQGIQGEKGDKGDKGDTGSAGTNGTNGINGKSAYEIWLDNGNTGTETDFLNWLKGGDGTNGINGIGIKNVAINNDGDLIVTFDDNTYINAGNVVNKSNKLNDNNKITFNTLNVTENSVYGKVSNTTEIFSFINEIEIEGNAGYTVYTDLLGTNSIPTKTVNLEIGDNVFYILETCGNDSNLYTVTIRRKPIHTVKFILEGDSQAIAEQYVEEDSYATPPTSQKLGYGYTFDYKFSDPITQNTTVNVNYIAIFTRSNAQITGLTDYGKTLTKLVIPSILDDVQITSISSYAFEDCSRLTSIEIPNSVTSIGNSAFYGCSSLTSIEIPDSATSIGSYAFYGCSSLTSVEIPNSVTSISSGVFYNCSSLISIEIPNSVTSIGNSAFYGCSSLTSIEIPDSATSIGSYAFYNCSSLISVEIPNSVTSIGGYAFSGCSSLESVEIPNSVTSIKDWVFSHCSSLESVEIPSSVTSIEGLAFYGCDELTEISYKGTVEQWSAIILDTNWNKYLKIQKVHCNDDIIIIGE